MNVYDFDDTIYKGDSTANFFRYCLKKHPGTVLRFSPGMLEASLRYAFGVIGAKVLKAKLFAFLRCLNDPEKLVEDFWNAHFSGIGEWYLRQRRPDDLIITASPDFLVGEAGRRLGFQVIGTRMDIRSGLIEGENCHDREKVRRFRELFPDARIEEFYSDSLSDAPLAEMAERAYMVNRGKLSAWK